MSKKQRYVRDNTQSKRRTVPLTIVITTFFILLLMRLWYLQVIKVDDYQMMSENNRLRFLPVAASRGVLMDRNGAVLVNNRPSFSISIIPQEVQDLEALLDRLASLLSLNRKELAERWTKSRERSRYYPVVIASNISREQVEIIEENRLLLQGIDVSMKPVREYALGNTASHLLGHIGEISEKELALAGYEQFNPGDYVGKNGIEKAWEQELHGADGGKQLEVDSRGRILRVISEKNPQVGNSLVLTIDSRLQREAEAAFNEQAGAAIVMDVKSGEVLAFVSSPNFDPALFSSRIPVNVWKGYLEDKRRPLENKAIAGQYPPGSTFKILTALAGLEAGLINENSAVFCDGAYTMGGNRFRCWLHAGHGNVNLKRSLKESCDVYYYRLGEQLGVDKIAALAERFHLGKPLGIGLVGEKGGLIPTVAWKQKRFGKKWFSGETLPVAIGQGYLLTTPLQLASMIATIANDGTVMRPHLVKRLVDPEGALLHEFEPETIGKTNINPRNLKLVQQSLYAVVNDPGGTGGNARLWDQKVAGKTGTSQVVKLDAQRKRKSGYQYQDHALFVAYAPFDKPEVAIAVVVEHGGGGGAVAAPIAGRILRHYFDLQNPDFVNGTLKTGKPDEEETPAPEQDTDTDPETPLTPQDVEPPPTGEEQQ